eukprot:10779991-Alexandrium_andersonii.AAC.1
MPMATCGARATSVSVAKLKSLRATNAGDVGRGAAERRSPELAWPLSVKRALKLGPPSFVSLRPGAFGARARGCP